MPRAAVYIDGFNLYHAIDDLGANHLKWCNYWRLSEMLISAGETLTSVIVATAHHPDFDKKTRHQLFLAALRNVNVTVLLGHYVKEPRDCRGCGRVWQQPTEKESDINLAVALVDDAHMDLFDTAYLVTSDTDQAAAARLFARRFPDKALVSVAPPGRSHSQHILAHCNGRAMTITPKMIEASLLPATVLGAGRAGVKRPPKYAPPA